jgi:hypothetical protein
MEKNQPKKKTLQDLRELLIKEGKKELERLKKRRELGPDGKMTPYPQKMYDIRAEMD